MHHCCRKDMLVPICNFPRQIICTMATAENTHAQHPIQYWELSKLQPFFLYFNKVSTFQYWGMTNVIKILNVQMLNTHIIAKWLETHITVFYIVSQCQINMLTLKELQYV